MGASSKRIKFHFKGVCGNFKDGAYLNAGKDKHYLQYSLDRIKTTHIWKDLGMIQKSPIKQIACYNT